MTGWLVLLGLGAVAYGLAIRRIRILLGMLRGSIADATTAIDEAETLRAEILEHWPVSSNGTWHCAFCGVTEAGLDQWHERGCVVPRLMRTTLG